MSTPTRLFSRAYRVGSQEGLAELHSSVTWFVCNRMFDRNFWRGQFTDELEVECNGVTATFDTTTDIAKQFFYPRYIDGELHEPTLTKRLTDVLARDSVFYDIGANVGYFTVFAARVCTEGAVHAFELDEKFIESIEQSLERNRNTAPVQLVRKAVTAATGETASYSNDDVPTIGGDSAESSRTETVALEDYVESRPPPDVLKIDVEGYEYEVLAGATETLTSTPPHTLFVEMHPDRLASYGRSTEAVLSLLDECGYTCGRLDDHRRGESEPTEPTSDTIDENVVLQCTRSAA